MNKRKEATKLDDAEADVGISPPDPLDKVMAELELIQKRTTRRVMQMLWLGLVAGNVMGFLTCWAVFIAK